MTTLGISLLVFTALSIIFVCLINKYIKVVTSSYYFYLIVSIGLIIYFVAGRWGNNIYSYNHTDLESLKKVSVYSYSVAVSKAFLLDMCPFMAFFIPVSLIFDKSRSIAKVLALLGLTGGLVTIFGGMGSAELEGVAWYTFVFLGQGINKLYFIMHYWMVIMSVLVILNSRTYTRWSWAGIHAVTIAFFAYVYIIVISFGITNNATGIVKGDWYGEYAQYASLANILNIPFPWIPVVCYMIVYICVMFLMYIKTHFTKDEKLFAGNYDPWYKNNMYYRYMHKDYLRKTFGQASTISTPSDNRITKVWNNTCYLFFNSSYKGNQSPKCFLKKWYNHIIFLNENNEKTRK